jgi:hypothetical protein
MKICPKCQQTYQDDNQTFCLNDGTALVSANAGGGLSDQSPETVMMNPAPPTNPNQQFGGGQQQGDWNPVTPLPPPPPQQPQFSMQPQAARQGGGSKTWLIVVGVLGVLLLLCGGGLVGFYFYVANRVENTIQTINSYTSPTPSSTNSSSTPSKSPANNSGVLSSEKFNQIKNDMSKSEVESILGGAGREVSSTKAGNATIATYEWKGAEYSVIYVIFRNDKVFSKTSANLK